MSQPPERIDSERLLARMLGPGRPELSCDECFAQLDRYVELELAGSDADATVPLQLWRRLECEHMFPFDLRR